VRTISASLGGQYGGNTSPLLRRPGPASSRRRSPETRETEHHVRESFTLHQYVVVKASCSKLLVTGADRLENAGVLLQRLLQTVTGPKLDAAIGAQPLV
jgi:hypothetical protein